MGFDCTLHVVDPASLASFVERFLGTSKKKHAFDKKFKNGAALFAEVKDKLASSPDEAARHLLQLCLMWCSCDAPHVSSRNLALSYWLPSTEAEDFPTELLSFNLSNHLRAIEEAHPAIAGKLSLGFDGNWSVGYFVEPANVAAARAFVEGQLGDVSADVRRGLEPLLKVLRVAEAKGLAYWEGTDLGVALGNPGWLKERKIAAELDVTPLVEVPGLYHFAHLSAIEGDRLVMTRAFPDELHVIDFAADPPSVTHVPDVFFGNLVMRDGVLYGNGRHKHKNPYGVYELRVAPALGEMVLREAPAPEDLSCVGLFDDGAIVAVPSKLGTVPRVIGHAATRDLELPPATDYYLKDFVLASFGDGSYLLGWYKQLYLLEGDAPPRLLPLPPELREVRISSAFDCSEHWSDKPGSIVLEGGGILRVTKDGRIERVAPEIGGIMQLVRGPDRAIIASQGDNESDDAFKILWPTMEVTSIKAKDLGVSEIRGLMYSPARASLVVRTGTAFVGVAWDQLAARPRRTLTEIAEKQQADRVRAEARRVKAWKADTERMATRKPPLTLPLPIDGEPKFVSTNDLLVHPKFGLGIVRSRLTRTTERISVAFEHADETLVPTDAS